MKISLITAFLMIALASCCHTGNKYAVINGHFQGNPDDFMIHLCKAEHGTTFQVATTKIGEDGSFGFNYSVLKPGLYVLNVMPKEATRRSIKDHNLKRFYLENGTILDVDVQEGKYDLIHTNSDKNKVLSAWNQKIDSVFTYSHGFMYQILDYKTFFPLLPGFVEESEEFKKTVNTGDSSFDELMKLMIEVDMNRAAMKMLSTPRMVHPKREDYPAYYDYLLAKRAPKSERILELPGGYEFIRLYALYAYTSTPESERRETYLLTALDFIQNNLLKGYYVVENLKIFKSYDDVYLGFMKEVEPYLANDYLKERVKEYELTIRQFQKGSTAFDFEGTDLKGKKYRLSDFRGKLVYVDVWATWCAPCKIQIPPLKELEKKLHNQDIVFLSISVDRPQDRKKWEAFVQENELKGIQLMADNAFESDVAKAYGINSIPRFMLFDKEGKVVSISAPRPTDGNTEEWLRRQL